MHFPTRVLLLSSALATLAGCSAGTRDEPGCGRSGETRCAVSLIALIADPASYDGRGVSVVGVASLEFEGTGIFLGEYDFRHRITKNGLWLDVDPGTDSAAISLCHGAPVIVEGTFEAANHGHLGMWSGAITKVQWLRPSLGGEPPTVTPIKSIDEIPDSIPELPGCGIKL
jgi:hypothetical protein